MKAEQLQSLGRKAQKPTGMRSGELCVAMRRFCCRNPQAPRPIHPQLAPQMLPAATSSTNPRT